MSNFTKLALLPALGALAFAAPAHADKRTVCTITVNSPDEQAAMRRHLPERDYRFVELVEHGRSDWLETACRKQVRCDVLVVSGHFNGTDFYTTRLDVNDHLPVAEMERASCSASCPGLFSQLKEVYLFGCNSLNADPGAIPSADVERSLVRSGYAPAEADRLSRRLGTLHAESNRDIMRRVFVDVPSIYGFSSTAPLGPLAASHIDRWFRSGGGASFGRGRADRRLPDAFAPSAITVVSGMTASDPRAEYRGEVCRFVDERMSAGERLRFVHQILARGSGDARLFFDRIEAFLASLTPGERNDPAFAAALDEIAGDRESRERFLALAHDAAEPSIRARMIDVAQALQWLSPPERHAELVRLFSDLLVKSAMSGSDVDLVCARNGGGEFDGDREALARGAPAAGRTDREAAFACLGGDDAHDRMLAALATPDAAAARMAEIYLFHRPIRDASELRTLTASVAAMTNVEAQVRALDALARLRVGDDESLAELVKLFARTQSVAVQRAIAGILLRADYGSIATAETLGILREHRLRAGDVRDAVDILIRRMTAS